MPVEAARLAAEQRTPQAWTNRKAEGGPRAACSRHLRSKIGFT